MTLQDRLNEAILYGDIGEVDVLLNQGADINEPTDNELPLSTAILNGEIEVAVHLLQRGADVRLPPLSVPGNHRKGFHKLNSWQPSPGTVVALQVALGIVLSIAVSKGVASHPNPGPAIQKIYRVLDFWIPWCATVISLGALMALQVRAAKTTEAAIGGAIMIAVLLCLYGIYCVLPESTRWFLATVFSWIWKGIVWRALFVVGLNVARHKFSRSQQKQEETRYPGLEIIQSLLTSKFKSEKLALALLDFGLFPETYIREWRAVERMVLMQEDPFTTFWATMASLGFDDAVHRLISLGIPVDTPIFASSTFNSTTLLGIAASSGQPRVVELLLEHGANVEGETPITLQSISPCTPLISCLLASDKYDSVGSGSRCEVVHLLIQAGADLNTPHHSEETALSLAVKKCSVDILRLLIKHSALPSPAEKQHGTLLHSATSRRDADELLELFNPETGNVNGRDDTGFTPLMRAAVEGKTAAARRLLTLGADPTAQSRDGWTVLQLAAWYGPKALLELLLNTNVDVNACEKSTNTALFQACRRHDGRLGVIKLLLEKGADPNVQARSWKMGPTPLHEVCRYSSNDLNELTGLTDQLETVKILLQYGADVNVKYSVEDVPDETNVTPLGLAAAHAPYTVRASILQTLLEADADPNGMSDMGLPALLTCCAYKCGEIDDANITDPVEVLLEKGADTSTKDKNGMTPLHHAAVQHKPRATISILSHLDATARAAAVDTQDTLGRTPLHLACADTHWMTRAAYEKWAQHQRPGNVDYANFHISLESNLVLSALRYSGANPYLPDANGATAMHIAAQARNPRIMGILLQWIGSRLLYDVPDRRGRLAFHYAVRSVEVVKMLLTYHQQGEVEYWEYFDVLEPETASLAAQVSAYASMEVAQWVYQRHHMSSEEVSEDTQASGKTRHFDTPDQLGNTPLHYAALAGEHEVVELYLSTPDIDVTCQNKDGETAMEFAMEERCIALIAEKIQNVKGFKKNVERSKERRKEAEEFVRRLGERDVWGVYGEGRGADAVLDPERDVVEDMFWHV